MRLGVSSAILAADVTVRSQDLGGAHGFGPVTIETDEPVFHQAWEGVVVAGTLGTMIAGLYNLDQFREAIDDLDPLAYMSVTYFAKWLHSLEHNCVRAGVFTPEEIDERLEQIAHGDTFAAPSADPEIAANLQQLISAGMPSSRHVDQAPRFRPGHSVRGRVLEGARHARIPRYAQGKPGVIHRVHEAFAFPDTNRVGEGENPEHVYSVRFDGTDLWPGGEGGAVYLDLWESYLEPGGAE